MDPNAAPFRPLSSEMSQSKVRVFVERFYAQIALGHPFTQHFSKLDFGHGAQYHLDSLQRF